MSNSPSHHLFSFHRFHSVQFWNPCITCIAHARAHPKPFVLFSRPYRSYPVVRSPCRRSGPDGCRIGRSRLTLVACRSPYISRCSLLLLDYSRSYVLVRSRQDRIEAQPLHLIVIAMSVLLVLLRCIVRSFGRPLNSPKSSASITSIIYWTYDPWPEKAVRPNI